jgi:hypothetical protein
MKDPYRVSGLERFTLDIISSREILSNTPRSGSNIDNKAPILSTWGYQDSPAYPGGLQHLVQTAPQQPPEQACN